MPTRMTTLKGIFPDPKPTRRKNFIQENVKSLRQMEQYFHNKDLEDLQNLHIHKQQKVVNKYQNITSKVKSSAPKLDEPSKKVPSKMLANKAEKTSHSDQNLSIPALFSKGTTCAKKLYRVPGNRNSVPFQKRPEKNRATGKSTLDKNKSKVQSDPSVLKNRLQDDGNSKVMVKYRNQGIQTMDDSNLDDLYATGVIRYATKKSVQSSNARKNVSEEEPDKIVKVESSPPSDRGDVCVPPVKNAGDGINYIKLNKQRNTVANKLASQLNIGVPPSSYRKGVVPKYLKDRKEALKKEEQAKADVSHADCPEGFVSLPDEERRETLRMLKTQYQECVNELNKLPIRTDTLKAKQRKIEIEKKLNKLEEGIKVFSRPNVFVKIDA